MRGCNTTSGLRGRREGVSVGHFGEGERERADERAKEKIFTNPSHAAFLFAIILL